MVDIEEFKRELAEQGIKPVEESKNSWSNYEEVIISDMEKITGKKYSEEQRKILEHRGNAVILACAGSGKTTITTHLIAKRLRTGEIKDVNKLIYATYSKAGALEMEDRLTALLDQLNIKKKVKVRTLHSFFLQIIRAFNINSNIISENDRLSYIRTACKEADYTLKDDELMLISNLLSYQVNNLLSDVKTLNSYVNTLEDLSLQQYTQIRQSYSRQKSENGFIDYDDMQSYLYLWLVKYAKSSKEEHKRVAIDSRNYCKAMWTDFYIDEAQDVSKIQFEIIRAMVTDIDNPDKLTAGLVFIGDDDQCLLEDTKVLVHTNKGNTWKNIDNVRVGDTVVSASGKGTTKYTKVSKINKRKVENERVYKIKTHSGNEVTATKNHIAFSNGNYNSKSNDIVKYVMFGQSDSSYENSKSVIEFKDEITEERLKLVGNNIALEKHLDKLKVHNEIEVFADITEYDRFNLVEFRKLSKGMKLPIACIGAEQICIDTDEIESIKIENYSGTVYDLEVPETRNFIANGIVVHNCIYTWRGSDPSIILSIGPLFDISTFVLSTNYRCSSEIVDYATTGIKHNGSRYAKGMQAFVDGGNVKILPSPKRDLCSLSILAMNHIKHWIRSGYRLDEIAVLSRNNFHLSILSNMLLREGIYCNMTEDMKLTKSYMYKDVKNIINICEPTYSKELTSSVLWKLCRYLGVKNASIIANFQNESGLSLCDTLEWVLSKVNKDIKFNKNIITNVQTESRVKDILSRLTSDTLSDLYSVYTALNNSNVAEKLKTLLHCYLSASSFLYKSKDKNRSIVGLVMYINNLILKDGYEGMLGFLKLTEQFESGYMTVTDKKITLSTVHSAKGREWKNVIMFGCDNVSQPSIDGIATLIDNGIDIHDIYENIDEERRLFYVGNTRAKENLLIITYDEPSIFIMEALGMFGEIKGGNNDKVIRLVNYPDSFIAEYKNQIDKYIKSSNSKYYYDIDEYK